MEVSGHFRSLADLHLPSSGYKIEWASEVVWVLWRRGKLFIHAGNRNTIHQSLAVSTPLCILELSRLTRVEKAVKNTTIIVIYRLLVYIQILANYMFRPLLVRPSSGWIPSPRKYTIVLYNH